MIIRHLATADQLITQPDHAALAARILRQWHPGHFPDSPRKASILHAIEQHDAGWAGIDETLAVDPATGRLLDFMEVSDAVKRETSLRGIEVLASDPYAAALVAQHRLHVYRRYAGHPEWSAFFGEVMRAREAHLRAAAPATLAELLDDYRFVRAGDLASLAYCNRWADTDADGCGYSMRLRGDSLIFVPDPLAGRTIEFEIRAREMDRQPFASAEAARRALASAPAVVLRGTAGGSAE